MGGAGEGSVGRPRVARNRVDAHVRAGLLPEHRRAGQGRGPGRRHRGQGLVIHQHALGAIDGRRRGLGDHHGHRLAHEARGIRRQHRMRSDEDARPLATAEGELVRIGRHRAVRDGRQAIGQGVPAGEHCDHAGHSQRPGGVDAPDARVRVRRADELRLRLARLVEVVAIAPPSGDQPRVFLARHRLAEALAGGA